MHKLTKELIDDSSFEFLSSYLDVDLRENRESYKEIISTTKDIINNSLEKAKENLEQGNYKGSECAREIANLYDHVIKNYYQYLNMKRFLRPLCSHLVIFCIPDFQGFLCHYQYL